MANMSNAEPGTIVWFARVLWCYGEDFTEYGPFSEYGKAYNAATGDPSGKRHISKYDVENFQSGELRGTRWVKYMSPQKLEWESGTEIYGLEVL